MEQVTYALQVSNVLVNIICLWGVKRDLILSFVHTDFRVKMAQDDSKTPPTPPPQRFTIEDEQTRLYRRFNAQGTQRTVRLLPPPEGQEDSNPMSQFLDSVSELFEHSLRDLEDSDMVGITISNEVEVKDSCRDQLQKKGSDNGRCDLVGVREGRPIEC